MSADDQQQPQDESFVEQSGFWSVRWHRFICGLLLCVQVGVGLMLLQSLFRMIHLSVFSHEIGQITRWLDIVSALIHGIRFDGRATVMLLIPAGVVALIGVWWWPSFWRHVWTVLALFLSMVVIGLGSLQLGYVAEYGDVIDHHLFLILTDDVAAVMQTVSDGFPIIGVALALLAAAGMVGWCWYRIFRCEWWQLRSVGRWRESARVVAVMGIACVVIIAARGAVFGPKLKVADIAVSKDYFVNRSCLNAFMAFRAGHRIYRRHSNASTFADVLGEDKDVQDVAMAYRSLDRPPQTLTEAVTVTASGALPRPPRHVVLYILESCDAWPLNEPWQSAFNLMPELSALGERGYLARFALADGDNTSGAFGALISGLPQAAIAPQYAETARYAFPTAPAVLFKQLGYQTRIFYPGPPTWQDYHQFATQQGFDEVYSWADLPQGAPRNEWGVHDQAHYDFIHDHLDDSGPSFNVVITITNHPPFDLNSNEEGFESRQFPDDFPLEPRNPFEDFQTGTMAHHWIADKYFGKSVREIERRLPDVLVCATGDHFCRYYPAKGQPEWVQHGVPILFYGPGVLKPFEGHGLPSASHRDVVRTLVELSAPAGFEFPAFGRNLFAADADSIATGFGHVLGRDWFADAHRMKSLPSGMTGTVDEAVVQRARDRERYERALAWWWIRHGPDLADQQEP